MAAHEIHELKENLAYRIAKEFRHIKEFRYQFLDIPTSRYNGVPAALYRVKLSDCRVQRR